MRQHSRVTFSADDRLRTFDHHSEELLGEVADLSRGGLRLFTEQGLEAGQVYTLDLEVPVSSGRYRMQTVQMTCLWTRRNARLDRFEQGFTLAAPDPDFEATVDLLKLLARRSRSSRG